MTEITFYKTKTGAYRSFLCNGHAGYADHGHDIVCASISALVINAINSMEEIVGEPMEIETDERQGRIRCVFQNSPIHKDSELLMNSLVLGLTQIAKQYGKKHCRLKFEEV